MSDKRTYVTHCGASLSVIPKEGYGAEVRYLCIVPADEAHEWHRDRFNADFQWRTNPAQRLRTNGSYPKEEK